MFYSNDITMEDVYKVYSYYLRNYLSTNDKYIKKRVNVLINEIMFLSILMNKEYEIILNNMKEGLEDYLIDRLNDCITDKKFYSNKKQNEINQIWNNRCKLNQIFLENDKIQRFVDYETQNAYTEKITTEIALKLILFKNDVELLYTLLENKIHNLLKNSNTFVNTNDIVTYEDIIGDIKKNIINGLLSYQSKIFNGYLHGAKLLSYIDRIIKNTLNNHYKSNRYKGEGHMSGMVNEDDDQQGEFENNILYNNDSYEVPEFNNIENLTFDNYKYPLKYVKKNDTTLYLYKSVLDDLLNFDKVRGFNFILNKEGFYFFENKGKYIKLKSKVINSYVDILLLLLKYKNKQFTYENIDSYLNILKNNKSLVLGILGIDSSEYHGKLSIMKVNNINISQSKFNYYKKEVKKFILTFYYYNCFEAEIGSKNINITQNTEQHIKKNFLKNIYKKYKKIRSFEYQYIDPLITDFIDSVNYNNLTEILGNLYYTINQNKDKFNKNSYQQILNTEKKINKKKLILDEDVIIF